ncbi:FMN-dependent NADH-azoreductase [Entomoplasma ellychniae]|uniref:FMN dependent NADH:quinone oxidoreductase n=1 Tax=Entomoplasma ellychniae TaxID=2114 RepID=A0A8E2QYC4_9MOLU|nr:FMN-dependent NADH-azoreductase [Entomoplasma ellychniae]PPE04835.1 FMN-dependent NADH-azoreductase [Entomoplasma ellychniae]
MSKILVINGSVTPSQNSVSQELGRRFLEEYKKNNVNDEIIHLDLHKEVVGNNTLSQENFATYWSETEGMKFINQLKEVDKLIIIAPMYNFNISGLLKNYIDHVALANQTFSYKYSKKGDAIGLLDHLKVQILSSQGAPKGWYPWGDHVAYLQGTWNFMGGKVADPILLAGVKTEPLSALTPSKMVDSIQEEIIKKAAKF